MLVPRNVIQDRFDHVRLYLQILGHPGCGRSPQVMRGPRRRRRAGGSDAVVNPKTGQPLAKGDPRIGQPIGEREFARRKSIMQRQGYYEGGDA